LIAHRGELVVCIDLNGKGGLFAFIGCLLLVYV